MKLEFHYTRDDIRRGWRAVYRRSDVKRVGAPMPVYGLACLLGASGMWWYSLIGVHDEPLTAWTVICSIFAAFMVGAGFHLTIDVPWARRTFIREMVERLVGDPAQRGVILLVRRDAIVLNLPKLGEEHFGWNGWVHLGETEDLLLLFRGEFECLIVPKRAFGSAEQIDDFRELFLHLATGIDPTKAFPITVPGHVPAAEKLLGRLPPGPLKYLLVDAFTSSAFAGNPAATVWVDREVTEASLQALAMEFNQAETAFIRPRADGRFDLRWFTPTREVPLCGHATLASAWAMYVGQRCPADGVIRFVTRESGELVCRIEDRRVVVMDFPATPPVACEGPADAAAVLGIEGAVECVGSTGMNLTLRLANEARVRACRPDLARLATWHPVGVTVTAKGDAEGVDFVSRFFAPAAGIPEDPVTGSAHCALAVYWARELGKTRFVARQLSRRGGELEVALLGDRVELRGAVVVVMWGTIEA